MKRMCGWLFTVLFCLAPGLWAQEHADYYAMMMDGKKVGYAVQRRVAAEGQVTSTEQVHIAINRVGVPVTLDLTETAIETPDGKPLGFQAIQNFSLMTVMIKGKVRADGTMEVIAVDGRRAEDRAQLAHRGLHGRGVAAARAPERPG